MIKSILLCVCFVILTGCSSIGELVLNTAAGALGNMLDRRVEGELDNDVNSIDEKLENKFKEKKDECEDCKDDKR